MLTTKNIVNGTNNVFNSLSLANVAKKIAAESGVICKCTILGRKECKAPRMGEYLDIARGSETETQFIYLTCKSKGYIK